MRPPDLDTRLTNALERVAEDGRRRSRPEPAAFIRGRAAHRSRRRVAAVGATTAVALVAGGTGLLGGNPSAVTTAPRSLRQTSIRRPALR